MSEKVIYSEILEELKEKNEPGSFVHEPEPAYTAHLYTVEDYRALPEEERCELIDGSLYRMEAPLIIHQSILRELTIRFALYIREKGGACEVFFAPCDVQLDMDQYTMVQPDLFIICDREKKKLKNIYGAPDFVLEILSPSTWEKDLQLKLRKYRLAGVREYWCVDPERRRVYVFWFEQSKKAEKMRENEKNLGVTILSEEENPTVYDEEEDIPVGIYQGDLRIRMKEIFANLG